MEGSRRRKNAQYNNDFAKVYSADFYYVAAITKKACLVIAHAQTHHYCACLCVRECDRG